MLNEEGEVEDIEYEDFDQDINHLEDELYEIYLTKDQYLNAEILEHCSHDNIYQTEPKKSYNLRYGVKQVFQNPKNKVMAKQYPDLPLEKKQNQRPSKGKITELEETNKANQGFNFENELNKLKIPIQLIELMKIPSFKDPTYRMLKSQETGLSSDVINLHDKHPNFFIGAPPNHLEKKIDHPPPFYVTLTIHEQMLHNCLLDSGASHNLMPKAVMESLGISITRPYHDMFYFDSRTFQCLGLIH